MPIEKHDLHHEFPEFYNEIHELKLKDAHFARLFKEYHELDKQVLRIEEGVENTSDEFLETKKRERLALKDNLFAIIKNYQAESA